MFKSFCSLLFIPVSSSVEIPPGEEGRFLCVVDADPPSRMDDRRRSVLWGCLQAQDRQIVAEKQSFSQQGAAVLRPGQTQSLAQLSRPVQKLLPLIGGQVGPLPSEPVPAQEQAPDTTTASTGEATENQSEDEVSKNAEPSAPAEPAVFLLEPESNRN